MLTFENIMLFNVQGISYRVRLLLYNLKVLIGETIKHRFFEAFANESINFSTQILSSS
jgi:hypothetical protein